MLKIVKQAFTSLLSFSGSLVRVAKVSDRSKCISPNNEPCLARLTLIDLYPNKFHYYPSTVSLDRFNESCNTLDDPPGRMCVLNKKYSMI